MMIVEGLRKCARDLSALKAWHVMQVPNMVSYSFTPPFDIANGKPDPPPS